MKGGTTLPAAAAILLLSLAVVANAAGDDAALLKDIVQVSFTTASATAETYKSFIASVRAGIVSTTSNQRSNGIPVLLSKDNPNATLTSLNVTLVNKAARSVSLNLDITGAYFAGYEAGDYTCYLTWTSDRTFKKAICFPTNPWGSSSSASSSASSAVAGGENDDDRSSGRLMMGAVRSPAASTWRLQDLDDAISTLYLYATGSVTDDAAAAAAIATCDTMIISAAMFPYIERRLSSGMWSGNGVADDPSLHALPSTWPSLSAAVQESFQAAFAAPVTLPFAGGKSLLVDNVRTVAPFLPFLLFDDRCAATKSSATPMLIRSVVEELEDQSSSCPQAEPTVHLAGPEGRCVDVPYGWYYSGKEVQLWSCKSGADSNQLWTLKRDGTIRSNGMCLAAKSAKTGATVVIADCSRVTADVAVWEVRVDGTVALRSSGLALSATSSALWAGLKVQADDRGTAQSWTPTNNTAPVDASILGYRDLCLQVESSSGAVAVAACGDGNTVWSIYPDGSLRPPAWLFLQWGCLAADGATGKVTTKVCDGRGSACERWVFRNDGSILNTGTGLVLDVKPTGAKRGTVVVSKPVAGSATQKWALVL